jgi:hypothetical protein
VSHSNRNFAVSYVFLVALPIAGLAGILRSGRSLKAPISLDGGWNVQAADTKGTLSPCMSALGLDGNTPVTISQSGENFVLNSGKAAGNGLFAGLTLQASLKPAGSVTAAPKCGGDGSVVLTANVDAKASPRVLSGALSIHGCPSCESVEFHAVKQSSTQKKGAQ